MRVEVEMRGQGEQTGQVARIYGMRSLLVNLYTPRWRLLEMDLQQTCLEFPRALVWQFLLLSLWRAPCNFQFGTDWIWVPKRYCISERPAVLNSDKVESSREICLNLSLLPTSKYAFDNRLLKDTCGRLVPNDKYYAMCSKKLQGITNSEKTSWLKSTSRVNYYAHNTFQTQRIHEGEVLFVRMTRSVHACNPDLIFSIQVVAGTAPKWGKDCSPGRIWAKLSGGTKVFVVLVDIG